MSKFARLRPSPTMIGIVLISLAGLALEITLTRLFSVLFFYNYVFLLLSLAILGIGVGATWAYQTKDVERLALLAWGASLSVILLALLITLPWPFDLRWPLLAMTILPYFFIGALSARLFRDSNDQSGLLYAADLIGGALGILATLWGIPNLGGVNTLLTIPFFLGLAALTLQPDKRLSSVGLFLVAAMLGQNLLMDGLQIDPAQLPTAKPLTRQLTEKTDTQIAYTAWDSFGRVDVLETRTDPSEKLLFLNGAAGSVMLPYPQTNEERNHIQTDLGYFPFEFASPQETLILGPGGGKDILYAHLAESKTITAIEISPSVVEALVEFGPYNGNLASLPAVDLIMDEGRSYLRRSGEQYDMIYLSEVTSLSAELAGYMLAENYIYTTEAVHDYLDHLKLEGWLVFKLYDEFTLTRAFTTVAQALIERGHSSAQAARHIVVVLDPKIVSQQQPFREPLLMVSRQPLEASHGQDILAHIQESGFIPVFIPHSLEQGPLGALIQGTTTLESLIAGFERGDIQPTHDESPFFYEFELGLPHLLKNMLLVLVAVTLVSVGYLAWQKRKHNLTVSWRQGVFFFSLGIGFMLLEVGMIQRLSLFLGHPTYSLSVVLLSLLVGGGIGSILSHHLGKRQKRPLSVVGAAIAVTLLALAHAFLLPPLLKSVFPWPHWGRIALSWSLLLPLGIAMGIPFPSALRKTSKDCIPLAWGINGIGTVLGAVGAMTVAMSVGFQVVLLVGAGLYFLAAVLAWNLLS